MLDDTDAAVRGAAVDAIMFAPIMQSTIRPEHVMARLAERINDPDPFVRGRLRISPHFWKTPAVAEPFGKALAGDRSHCLAALEAMAFGMPVSLGPAVEKLLDHPDPIVRARAHAAVGNLSLAGPLAMRLARAVLSDKSPAVRQAAGESLARMSRADMVIAPGPPDVEPRLTRRTVDLNIPPALAAADPRAFALVEAYSDQMNIDKVLDLLGGDDPAGVDAAVALLGDLHGRPWGTLKPLISRAAARGGRGASIVGMVVVESTRSERAGHAAPPDESNALTRAIRAAQAATGRDAALARLALRETPTVTAAAAQTLISDPVAAVRAIALRSMSVGEPAGSVPAAVLAALDDPDPSVAQTVARGIAASMGAYRGPPPEVPEPATDQLAAADATVRAKVVAESAIAAGGRPVLLHEWSTMMNDPDPAVRAALAVALRQTYAARPVHAPRRP